MADQKPKPQQPPQRPPQQPPSRPTRPDTDHGTHETPNRGYPGDGIPGPLKPGKK
jgi:hypothetical protein